MAVANSPFPILPSGNGYAEGFTHALRENGVEELLRAETATLQINVGKLCNQACHHCHVDAGPKRTEIMPADIAHRVMELLAASPSISTVDITGGAPELNPNFRWLVEESQRLGRHVIDRCNLTVLLEETQQDLAEFLAEHRVEIIASLPCYTAENVNKQRGKGVFEKSMDALRKLNGLGYGLPDSDLKLGLVYNPVGASLPPPQVRLEADYKQHLREEHGIEFHQLMTITNMPIHRFEEDLQRQGKHDAYMELLRKNFNAATLHGLMCRSLVSIGYDGRLYDCDFNQMLDMGLEQAGSAATVWDVESFTGWAGRRIATGGHCFGCTAGAGSSCTGALA
ncbi:MAG TPA: arsenosugar biosynthesis radical SAM (seleno)protein ArsS [Candidatus Acidoferrum sp.]|nr:arsenosugar biosynthesis radical SAM (seleno)protein ArsS [Candidatus Acidoferrum sp.]